VVSVVVVGGALASEIYCATASELYKKNRVASWITAMRKIDAKRKLFPRLNAPASDCQDKINLFKFKNQISFPLPSQKFFD
jgi:hypothetical protein